MIVASINQPAFGDNIWLDFSKQNDYQTAEKKDDLFLIKNSQNKLIGINLLNWSSRLGINKTHGFIPINLEQISKISQKIPEYQDVLNYELTNPYFTVAKIKSINPHPRLSRLKIIEIDIGQKDLVSWVSGSINLKFNLHTVYARPGAILPNGKKILKSKIGGVKSPGTLCNRTDLNLNSPEIKGAIEITDSSVNPGTDFAKIAKINYK